MQEEAKQEIVPCGKLELTNVCIYLWKILQNLGYKGSIYQLFLSAKEKMILQRVTIKHFFKKKDKITHINKPLNAHTA